MTNRLTTVTGMCLLGMLPLPALSLFAQDTGVLLLTLSEAIALSDQGNINTAIAQKNVEKAATGVRQARTQYYPQLKTTGLVSYPFQALSFTIPKGTLGTYPGIGPLPGADAVIAGDQSLTGFVFTSVSQPLTQLYKVHLAVKQAGVGVQLASEQQRLSHQQLVQQVRQVYYSLPALQAQVHALESSVSWLQSRQKEAEKQLQQKAILRSDLLALQARLAQQLYQERLASDALVLQKEALNRLLSRPLNQDFRVEEKPSVPELQIDAVQVRAAALAQRPELRQAKLQAAAAEYDVRRQRAEYIPQVNLTVNEVTLSGNKSLPAAIGGVGLQFSWQPFDWGQKKQQLRALKIENEEAALNQQDARQAVLLDVDRTLNALHEAMLAVDVSRAVRDAESEKLREVQAQYDQKVVLISTLLQERSSVDQDEGQYVQALTQLWTAWANLHRALGEDE